MLSFWFGKNVNSPHSLKALAVRKERAEVRSGVGAWEIQMREGWSGHSLYRMTLSDQHNNFKMGKKLASQHKMIDIGDSSEEEWPRSALDHLQPDSNDLFHQQELPPLETTRSLSSLDFYLEDWSFTDKYLNISSQDIPFPTPNQTVSCHTLPVYLEPSLSETPLPAPSQSSKSSNKLSLFYMGHLHHVLALPNPIFGYCRKFERTKRKRGKDDTYFKTVARAMRSVTANRINPRYAKRFDQGLQQKFVDMKESQHQASDLTVLALRRMAELHNDDGRKLLRRLGEKYEGKRHWARLLASFVEVRESEEDEWDIQPPVGAQQ